MSAHRHCECVERLRAEVLHRKQLNGILEVRLAAMAQRQAADCGCRPFRQRQELEVLRKEVRGLQAVLRSETDLREHFAEEARRLRNELTVLKYAEGPPEEAKHVRR